MNLIRDTTIKVLQSYTCITNLLGHTFPVWTLAILPNSNNKVSGSDATIRIWQSKSRLKNPLIHSGTYVFA